MRRNLQCAAIFSDHMVLQQKKETVIWGYAFPNWCVAAILLDENGTVLAKAEPVTVTYEKKWELHLPPVAAGGPYDLRIEASGMDPYIISEKEETEVLQFTDVMVGEVWLAGGQSNMELELRNSLNGKAYLKLIEEEGKHVRFFFTKKNAVLNDSFFWEENNNSWRTASEENSAVWSAVGYYFAKQLSDRLGGITVGLIGCNWGGSSAANWVSREDLTGDLACYLQEYREAYDPLRYDEYLKAWKQYNEYTAIWQNKIDQIYAENPKIKWEDALKIAGECQWPGPMGPESPYRPAGLYETMLRRVAPYTLAGFLYYQAEADEQRAGIYDQLMKKLIARWRAEWKDDTLPFIMTQLPMYAVPEEINDEKWPNLRERQWMVAKEEKNVELAVALDLGEFNNIHPVEKRMVGERLAKKALVCCYQIGDRKDAFGPEISECRVTEEEKRLQLFFDYAEGGFDIKRRVDPLYDEEAHAPGYPDSCLGFEIAGEDGKYYPADPEIHGNVVLLSSSQVERPVFARYEWRAFAPVYLFGKNGIPLAPFRIQATGTNDPDA